jgi:diadenosine tetraphosphate (Ap4A) HIT family hydrolase
MALTGFHVPHAHIHLIPLQKGITETFVDYTGRSNTEADPAELAAMAKRLAF